MKSALPRRRLIPRWRPISKTLRTSEPAPASTQPQISVPGDAALLDQSIIAWRANHSAGYLGDILAFGLHAELIPRVLDVAHQAKAAGLPITPVQLALVEALQSEQPVVARDSDAQSGKFPFQRRIRELRQLLRIAPGSTFALLDYAQLQAAIGRPDIARRALNSARTLAPNNRIVLRTTARFLVHTGDVDAAHAIIRRHAGAATDPWLLASEIALSDVAGKPSAFLARSRRLLAGSRIAPATLTELAGAIASAELGAGQIKAARAALRLALRQPNDNVVAQAQVERKHLGIALDEPKTRSVIETSAEAQLSDAWDALDIDRAEQWALAWHDEEPFSSRPIQFLTSLYSLRGDFSEARHWVMAGILADPKDSGMLVNLAFVEAALDRREEAERAVRRAASITGEWQAPFLSATRGLLAMKANALEEADSLYRAAHAYFLRVQRPEVAALCLANYARAALAHSHPRANEILTEARDAARRNPTPDSRLILGTLGETQLTSDSALPAERRPAQWIFDPQANTLTKSGGPSLKEGMVILTGRSPHHGQKKK